MKLTSSNVNNSEGRSFMLKYLFELPYKMGSTVRLYQGHCFREDTRHIFAGISQLTEN